MENAIIAQNIKRYFKAGDGTTVHALDGVSMEIKKGTLAILKGRSGSGKTTLLNILSALDMPTEGSVQFLDKNLEHMTEKDREILRRYEMGFVFQSIALIPTMTAYENVEFALRLAKNKRQIQKNLIDMDNDIGDAKNDVINENTHDRVSELLVVFADEPTGALDTASGFEVMRLFRELIDDEDITIVMTTHDPNLMELGDEVFELSDGIVI